MSFIKVSSTRGDYVLVNLAQVVWATVDTGGTSGVNRITLHMVDGATFSLKDTEAQLALTGLETSLGELPGAPGLQ